MVSLGHNKLTGQVVGKVFYTNGWNILSFSQIPLEIQIGYCINNYLSGTNFGSLDLLDQ